MKKKEIKELIRKAEKNDPKRTSAMCEIYATTDMDFDEFIGHIKIIAEK